MSDGRLRDFLAALRDALICFVLGMVIVIAGYAMIRSATAEDEKPAYCYVTDARATAPECGE